MLQLLSLKHIIKHLLRTVCIALLDIILLELGVKRYTAFQGCIIAFARTLPIYQSTMMLICMACQHVIIRE